MGPYISDNILKCLNSVNGLKSQRRAKLERGRVETIIAHLKRDEGIVQTTKSKNDVVKTIVVKQMTFVARAILGWKPISHFGGNVNTQGVLDQMNSLTAVKQANLAQSLNF